MNLIACADSNWGIGYGGDLLFHIPEDLKRFRAITLDKTVVMGRKTLESLPGGKPLSGRLNVVFTRDKGFNQSGVITVNSIEEFLQEFDAEDNPGIFVIGGEKVYNTLLPYCRKAYITRVYAQKNADVYIADLDKSKEFVLSERSELYDYKGLKYTYDIYENINPL